MDKILEQVSKFEITDKTVIAITGDLTMEHQKVLRIHIEKITGIKPPIIMTGDGDLSAIDITESTLLVIKGEYNAEVEDLVKLFSIIRERMGIMFPAIFLDNDGDITAIQDKDELMRLRDKIDNCLSNLEEVT